MTKSSQPLQDYELFQKKYFTLVTTKRRTEKTTKPKSIYTAFLSPSFKLIIKLEIILIQKKTIINTPPK